MNKNRFFLLLVVVALVSMAGISCYTLFNDVYITSPVDGEYITDSTVSIEIYSSGEVANLEVFHNGVLWYSLDGGPLVEISTGTLGTFSTSVTVTGIGSHEIEFIAADSFFNVAQATVPFDIN